MERYSNWDKYPDVHSFAITDTGEGIVFHSPTTNGGKMYLNQRTTRNFKKNLQLPINKKKNKPEKDCFRFCLIQKNE